MLLFVLWMDRDSRSKNERHILEEYESMKSKVEVINTFPPDIRIALDTCWPDLKKSVSEINWHIEKNKTNLDNPFNRWLMSEKIATLEPLRYE